jgi:DNA-binding NtrC family response regulator
VIATSNRNLKQEVSTGRFREDLYYRLEVVPLVVPPLRERSEDIPALVRLFLNRAADRLKREPCALAESALDLLSHYDWPGNVRELENMVTRASVLNTGGPITADELRPWLAGTTHKSAANVPAGLTVEEMERQLIEVTLAKYNGHRARTAEALGIGLRTLSGKLKAYGYAPREKPVLIAT